MLQAFNSGNVFNQKRPAMISNPEMVLLGEFAPGYNQTRVLSANYDSSLIRPADLDAFLQGCFKAVR